MNTGADRGCLKVMLGTLLVVGVCAAVIAVLFVIWLNGGLTYTIPIDRPASASAVCPARFDADSIVIMQRRQTVICVYDDHILISERVEER